MATRLRALVLGGARSGKSSYAESLFADARRPTYVATSGDRPDDEEWLCRVARHRERRGERWRTVETTDLAAVLRDAADGEPLLLDCLALWLAHVLDESGVWAGAEDGQVEARCDELVAAWASTRAWAVVVSNEVGSGVVPATVSGRRYRDELGRLNARMAAVADSVALVVAGIPVPVKSPPGRPAGPGTGAP